MILQLLHIKTRSMPSMQDGSEEKMNYFWNMWENVFTSSG